MSYTTVMYKVRLPDTPLTRLDSMTTIREDDGLVIYRDCKRFGCYIVNRVYADGTLDLRHISWTQFVQSEARNHTIHIGTLVASRKEHALNVRIADEPLSFVNSTGQPIFTILPDGRFMIGDQEMAMPAVQQAMFAQFAQDFVEEHKQKGKTIVHITSHAAQVLAELEGLTEVTPTQHMQALRAACFPEVAFDFDPAIDGNIDVYLGLLRRIEQMFFSRMQMAQLREQSLELAARQREAEAQANRPLEDQVVDDGVDRLANGESRQAQPLENMGSLNGKPRIVDDAGNEVATGSQFTPVNPPVDAPPLTAEDMAFLASQQAEAEEEARRQAAETAQVAKIARDTARGLDVDRSAFDPATRDAINNALASGGAVSGTTILTQDDSFGQFKKAWAQASADADTRELLALIYPQHVVSWNGEQVLGPGDPTYAAAADSTTDTDTAAASSSTTPSGERLKVEQFLQPVDELLARLDQDDVEAATSSPDPTSTSASPADTSTSSGPVRAVSPDTTAKAPALSEVGQATADPTADAVNTDTASTPAALLASAPNATLEAAVGTGLDAEPASDSAQADA